MNGLLPPGFETLERFASRWAGGSAADRARLRAAGAEDERDAFHAACAPLLEPGLARLDEKPLAALDEQERRLLRLFLTFAHVSLAVEVQGPDEDRHSPLRESMRITRSTADR
jgi:hypothetical protein